MLQNPIFYRQSPMMSYVIVLPKHKQESIKNFLIVLEQFCVDLSPTWQESPISLCSYKILCTSLSLNLSPTWQESPISLYSYKFFAPVSLLTWKPFSIAFLYTETIYISSYRNPTICLSLALA